MSDIYLKSCPICNNQQTYKTKYKLERAIKNNTCCNSCNHKKPSKLKKDLTGNIYGRLKVIKFYEKRKQHQYWLCECNCGNTTIVKHSHLTCQSIRSCGCSHFYTNSKHPHWTGYKEIPGSYLCVIKQSAKRRNLEFKLSSEYIWNLYEKQNRKCALTGELIEFNKTAKDRDGTASLDRIDSSKGYVEGNVQWVHKIINVMKQDLTDKKFIEMCNKVIHYRKDLL